MPIEPTNRYYYHSKKCSPACPAGFKLTFRVVPTPNGRDEVHSTRFSKPTYLGQVCWSSKISTSRVGVQSNSTSASTFEGASSKKLRSVGA